MKQIKRLLALSAVAVFLGGCATAPQHESVAQTPNERAAIDAAAADRNNWFDPAWFKPY